MRLCIEGLNETRCETQAINHLSMCGILITMQVLREPSWDRRRRGLVLPSDVASGVHVNGNAEMSLRAL